MMSMKLLGSLKVLLVYKAMVYIDLMRFDCVAKTQPAKRVW